MPERFNFITENFYDKQDGVDLLEELSGFCLNVILNEFETLDKRNAYFISGQAIEEDSNAAPLELKMLFVNNSHDIACVFINDKTEHGVLIPIPELPHDD